MQWNPALLQPLVGVIVMVTLGLAVLGQVRWLSTQGWRSLAEANKATAERLASELKDLQDKTSKNAALEEARAQALEAQLAQVQRLNYDLQIRVDKAEKAVLSVKEKTDGL